MTTRSLFSRSARSRLLGTLCFLVTAQGCARGPAVQTTLPLRRVVVYRNGVGYFERGGVVHNDEIQFRVLQSEVGDFLATLAVMERGGSTVRSAAFPMPADPPAEGAPPVNPRERRAVRVSLDGTEHDLLVGYTVETPIWRPSYRLVFNEQGPQVQAWGIVQNLSGEDWTDVRLSLVAGAPVSFRTELATAMIPLRPEVTDRGAVIDAVPQSDVTLAQNSPETTSAPAAQAPPSMPMGSTADALEEAQNARGGLVGRASAARSRAPRRPQGGAPVMPSAAEASDMPYYRGIAPASPPPPPPQPSASLRNVNALAALAVQGGATRYDLPQTVTIPDHSATMVMLVARDVPGAQMYLFAPDGGVPDSASHPFHVARFENRTGALLERGPIAIFERGAFLGEGMLETLPDGATTTVPFALERGVVVESNATWAQEGSRLVRMVRDNLTVERYNVSRTTYRLRNGMDTDARVLIRHALGGAQVFEPPTGTEESNGNALVPAVVPHQGHIETIVVTRAPFTVAMNLEQDEAANAIETYLREGHPTEANVTALRTALDMRRQMLDLTRDRAGLQQRFEDLQRNAEETRDNLRAIQRNATAADLRAQLTTRLAQVATQVDQVSRRIVELDTQVSERRVRLAEAIRGIDIDTSHH